MSDVIRRATYNAYAVQPPSLKKRKSRLTRLKPAEPEQGPIEASGAGRTLSQEDVSKKAKKKTEGEELRNFISQEIAELKDELGKELVKTNEELKKMNFNEEVKKIKEEMKELKFEINSKVAEFI